MNKLLLNLVMLFAPIWSSMGADTDQLRAILHTRLLLDDRKPVAIGMRQNKQKKDRSQGTLMSSIIFLAMGGVYMFPILGIPDVMLALSFYFLLLLVALTFMLITDFSSVLFDARDKYIIFPRPVTDRTIVLSRMLHVFIYLLRIILPLSLPGWIASGVEYGWPSAVLFPFIVILLVFIALFIVNSVYLLVLRLTKPEKFKDIINYFQVITSLLFFASVYLLPRLFKNGDEQLNVHLADFQWLRFLPSYWLASCWSWLGFHSAIPGVLYYSLLAVIFPFVCLYALITWLSPQFSRRIAGIDAVDTAEQLPGVRRKKPSTFYKRLAYLLNKSDGAKAGFMIAWLQTSRSRAFRMKVYPAFGFIPIYFIYMLTMGRTTISQAIHTMGDHPRYLIILYMCSFAMVSALTYVGISDQYKASWVYYSTPLSTPGHIMAGAFKAIWVKYFLPFFTAIAIFTLCIWGYHTIIDILLALVNVSLVAACIARISFRHLPFSIAEQLKQGGGRIFKSMIVMIVPVALGGGHYLALHMLWLKIIFIILSSILLWLVLDSYAETTWDSMVKSEME
jgi:hypothetical protein